MHQTYFYGHGVFPLGLIGDIGLAALAPAWAALLPIVWSEAKPKLHKGLMAWWAFLLMPNSTYLFLEFKHIVLTDGIADERPVTAVVAFGAMSAFGLATAILTILIAVRRYPIFRTQPRKWILILSFCSAVGAVIGEFDLTTLQVFACPPLIVPWLVKLAAHPLSLLLIAALTVLLSGLSLVCERLMRAAPKRRSADYPTPAQQSHAY